MELPILVLFLGLAALLLVLGADISHVLTLSWARNGETIAQTVTLGADGEANRNVTVAGSATNMEVDIGLDVSALQEVYVLSDQDLTLKTNSTGSPDDTLTLTANKPLIWYVGCGWANPLTADVTKFYFTNAGTTPANVKVRTLQDTTP